MNNDTFIQNLPNKFFTKGDNEDVLSRIGQVHTLTMYCPLNDMCVLNLKSTFMVMLAQYQVDENLWKGVPTIDALNSFIVAAAFQDNFGGDADKGIMGVIVSSLKMFRKLKIINFQFTDDLEIENTYQILLKKKKEEVKKYIYKVEKIEMNLSDLFSQNVIDIINKVFILNEIIPNSYLERKFLIDFKYDDYVSFMEMFINNNQENLNTLDRHICEYFNKFPKLIKEQKPDIRILTNYID